MEKLTKAQAIKEAKELYQAGGIDDWTQKEFVEDYLEALRDDGILKE